MLICLWLQENDEQTVEDEMPEASTDVSVSKLHGLLPRSMEEMPQAPAKVINVSCITFDGFV